MVFGLRQNKIMNKFQRKIGPKLGENNNIIPNNEFKLNIPEGTDIVSFRNSDK